MEGVAQVVTVVTAVAELLLGLGSEVDAPTVAVLLIITPLATELFTVATMVMVAEALATIELNVTVLLLPVPLQTLPPVVWHETKDMLTGRSSVTVTDVAASGPLLETRRVYVMFEPAATGLGAAVRAILRSAPEAPTVKLSVAAPPPGVGLKTVILTVPGAATSAAGIAAVS